MIIWEDFPPQPIDPRDQWLIISREALLRLHKEIFFNGYQTRLYER